MNIAGRHFKEARLSVGITQQQVAVKFECEPQFISLIESGRSAIPSGMIKKTAKLLKLTRKEVIDWIVEDYRQELDRLSK